jgi:hypothetical protein
VRLFTVIAERFAVIARHHDQRRARQRAHIVQQRRERGIGRGDFAQIRLSRVLRVERRRRPIRRVRIEHVHPNKPWLLGRWGW